MNSKVGRGTIFKLSLPKAESALSKPDLPVVIEQTVAEQETPGVVVIDDDRGTRDSLQRLLIQWGYETFVFDGGESAVNFLEKVGKCKPWLILLDYRLARGKTGFSVADSIKSLGLSRARISLMTGDIGTDIAEGAEQRWLILMRKPIQPIRLNALLSSAIELSLVAEKLDLSRILLRVRGPDRRGLPSTLHLPVCLRENNSVIGRGGRYSEISLAKKRMP